jgi:hypothetical protein
VKYQQWFHVELLLILDPINLGPAFWPEITWQIFISLALNHHRTVKEATGAHATAAGTPLSPPPPGPHCCRRHHCPSVGTSSTQGVSTPCTSMSPPAPPSTSRPRYRCRQPPAGPCHRGESFPVRFHFPRPSPHCRQQEPAGPSPTLRCLTLGVQYAYKKDSENTRLHCCEKVLIESDQWSSSFVLK